MGVTSTKPQSVIKSIQRGTVQFYNQPSSVNITISAVDTSKSVVLISGSGRLERTTAVASYVTGFATRSFQATINSATQINVTSFNFGITDVNGFADGSASWQVIEYV